MVLVLLATAATRTTPIPCSAHWGSMAGLHQLFLCSLVVQPLMPETRVAVPTVMVICSRRINVGHRVPTERIRAAATWVRLNAKSTKAESSRRSALPECRVVGEMACSQQLPTFYGTVPRIIACPHDDS